MTCPKCRSGQMRVSHPIRPVICHQCGYSMSVAVWLALKALLPLVSQMDSVLKQFLIDQVFSPRRDELEAKAAELTARGVNFSRIPSHMYPGMPYITVGGLVEDRVVGYHPGTLFQYARDGIVPSSKLAGTVIFDSEGVSQIFLRERLSLEGRLRGRRRGGRLPGQRKRRD